MLKHIFKIKKFPNLFTTKQLQQSIKCLTTEIKPEINAIPDAEREKKLKILALEVDVARQEGRKAPDPLSVKPKDWEHMLTLRSRSARQKYYTYLWKIEKTKENEAIKKEIRRKETLERKEQLEISNQTNEHIIYGLMHTSFLLRIYDTTINHWHNNKLISTMLFGQKLIIDCSYDKHMIPRESINAAKQLMLSFAENRMNDQPFDLHFCNINRSGVTMKYLHSHIPTLYETTFPLHVHEKSFMDIFPKEKLVYLTPHCQNVLETFNHDDIYIIGAMVDKMNQEPLSLAKAKQLGIRMAKLPLDRYLQWGSGSGKSLTLNQMISILLDQKNHGDWNKSLQHVPRRKIYDREQRYEQKPFRPDLNKYKFNFDNLKRSQ